MPTITVAFLGFRKQWEIERIRKRAADNVEIAGVTCDASDEDVKAACTDVDVIIPCELLRTPLNFELFDRAPKLRLIQTLSAGVDFLPVNELAKAGIPVANIFGRNAAAVAEHTIFLIVGVCRQLQVQINQLVSGEYHEGFFERWEDFHELTGKRVGILGFGKIGIAVAKRLAGWDCELVYFDTAVVSRDVEESSRTTRVGLDVLLATSDIVTVHVPLNRTTKGMLSDPQFELMKQSGIVINTSRGPVVDEAALVRALDTGRIAGAGLDVTEVEPIRPDSPLLNRNNVLLTPHMAGTTVEALEQSLDFAIANVNRLAAGEEPQAIVQPV